MTFPKMFLPLWLQDFNQLEKWTQSIDNILHAVDALNKKYIFLKNEMYYQL